MNAHSTLREILAKASPLRSGDVLAGVAAANDEERVRAQMVLADVPLKRFLNEDVVPYEQDEITRLILDSHDAAAFAPISSFTVGQFRDWLLTDAANAESLAALTAGITPEMAAAASKLMRLQDLISPVRTTSCSIISPPRSTMRPICASCWASGLHRSLRRGLKAWAFTMMSVHCCHRPARCAGLSSASGRPHRAFCGAGFPKIRAEQT